MASRVRFQVTGGPHDTGIRSCAQLTTAVDGHASMCQQSDAPGRSITRHGEPEGKAFIERVAELGRERGVPARLDAKRGMGSHATVYYGDWNTVVKDRPKDIGPGLLAAMIRQLELNPDDFRSPANENRMQFLCPANLAPTMPGEVVVSFRDLPECPMSGATEELGSSMVARKTSTNG